MSDIDVSININRFDHDLFNVNLDCAENNFYDTYTPNDTHVYNMRDIQTNDGNPSGVVLPDNAYGIVVIFVVEGVGGDLVEDEILIGNMRIIDDNGYEYRTNSISLDGNEQLDTEDAFYTFNFNSEAGITHSDIVAFSLAGFDESGSVNSFSDVVEFSTALTDAYISFDVNILDNNENIFSCRNVIFACTDQDNPLLGDLLEFAAEDGTNGANAAANVASFEYGINEAIPHSKGGEPMCPGNNISEGFVQLQYNQTTTSNAGGPNYLFLNGLVGLNNGNGRGSIDGWWAKNCDADDDCDG